MSTPSSNWKIIVDQDDPSQTVVMYNDTVIGQIQRVTIDLLGDTVTLKFECARPVIEMTQRPKVNE